MITVLIGHRGVGKTSFLKRLADYAKAHTLEIETYDLDAELERAYGKTVTELFNQGEEKFREIEKEKLAQLIEQVATVRCFIAVGAGFAGTFPANVHRLWLRRATDSLGRSFLNRPRLNSAVSPFAEYQERFATREARFTEWADEELFLPEGYNGGLEGLVLGENVVVSGSLTVQPENFRDWPRFIAKRQNWNLGYWELRNDLLSPEQIELALETLPAERILFSDRVSQPMRDLKSDWALELGEPPGAFHSLSLHQREDDFASTLAQLSIYAGRCDHLKLAVEVKDFSELKMGHHWWLQNPEGRSFLPRSPIGRWRWYRSLFGPRMPMHFIREGLGNTLDQPPLWQGLLQTPFTNQFAAVLGSPVEHSRTPLEQREFFARYGWPVVAIDIPEAEFSFALEFLTQIGLVAAGVTSPLKKLAWACSTVPSSEARQMQSANTLVQRILENGGLQTLSHNTDVLALQELRAKLHVAWGSEFGAASGQTPSVWLWGGGGLKSSLKKVWPEAVEISARKPLPPEGTPDLLIWATGRHRNFVWPKIRPKLILDMNYSEDSPGLEWAVRENLPYQSGLEMFKVQARYQRTFWQGELE